MKFIYELMLIIKYFMNYDNMRNEMDNNPIELACLRKEYGRFTAVDDLSLGIRRNSFTGLLGPNGAGKSTTLKMMTNLAPGAERRREEHHPEDDDEPHPSHVGAGVHQRT